MLGARDRGWLLLHSGPAGIGKTPLIEEAVAYAKEMGLDARTGVAFQESVIL